MNKNSMELDLFGQKIPAYKKLTVELSNDSDVRSPCEEDGWKLYSFNRRHASFKHPDEFFPLSIGLRRKLEVGTAFVLSYFEHGNCAWMLHGSSAWGSCPDKRWDGAETAGLLIWEQAVSNLGAKSYEDRYKDAEKFVEMYTDWSNGAVYQYTITDENDKEIDACSGYFDSNIEYMFEEIRSYTGDAEEVEVTGEAAWLADYHDVKTKEAANAD